MTSLDKLITIKAAEFAHKIKTMAATAANEEEIRIKSERLLAFIEREADVKLEGRHEFTVASGRIDSVYSRVLIEYKNPKSSGDRIGPHLDSRHWIPMTRHRIPFIVVGIAEMAALAQKQVNVRCGGEQRETQEVLADVLRLGVVLTAKAAQRDEDPVISRSIRPFARTPPSTRRSC